MHVRRSTSIEIDAANCCRCPRCLRGGVWMRNPASCLSLCACAFSAGTKPVALLSISAEKLSYLPGRLMYTRYSKSLPVRGEKEDDEREKEGIQSKRHTKACHTYVSLPHMAPRVLILLVRWLFCQLSTAALSTSDVGCCPVLSILSTYVVMWKRGFRSCTRTAP